MLILLMVAAVGLPRPKASKEEFLAVVEYAQSITEKLGVENDKWNSRWWYAYTLLEDINYFVDLPTDDQEFLGCTDNNNDPFCEQYRKRRMFSTLVDGNDEHTENNRIWRCSDDPFCKEYRKRLQQLGSGDDDLSR